MGRATVRSAAASSKDGRRRKAPAGIQIKERDGNWHLVGTVRVDGCSIRVRETTGLPATPDTWEGADLIKQRRQREIRKEVIEGVKPSRPLGIAACEYLGLDDEGNPLPEGRASGLGPTQINVILELEEPFGRRTISSITSNEWNAFLDKRHSGNSADTRARYCAAIFPFLKWCAAEPRGYLEKLPAIIARPEQQGRGKVSKRRRERRRVAELTPDLLAFIFDHASLHLRAQLYTEWSTGGRVSSVLFGCTLSDLILTKQRQQLKFRYTKNGDDVTADLHPECVQVLTEYLAWRGELHLRNCPLFLTLRKQPYSTKGLEKGWGGANKTAFNAMKRRAIHARLRMSVKARRAGSIEVADQYRSESRLIRSFTQHWLRHWFATYGLATGMSRQAVMNQAGWLDERSIARYEHDVPSVRRAGVLNLPITRRKREAGTS